MAGTHTSRIVREFNELPDKIKEYCSPMERLINDDELPWDAVIAYFFTLCEAAQRRTIYYGLVKLHGCSFDLTWQAVDGATFYKDEFRDYYRKVFGKKFPARLDKLMEAPSKVRNKIMHGSNASEADKKKATLDLIRYTKAYNDELEKVAGFEPFGSLQGKIKQKNKLNNSTTKWVLKGMGFSLS